MEIRLTTAASDRQVGLDLLDEALAEAGLTKGVRVVWSEGTWSLSYEDGPIWDGVEPNVRAWTEALLEAWWGPVAGGCC